MHALLEQRRHDRDAVEVAELDIWQRLIASPASTTYFLRGAVLHLAEPDGHIPAATQEALLVQYGGDA